MTEGTAAAEQTTPARATVQPLPLAIAAVLGIAGARLLLLGDRLSLTGGVLLCVAGLAAGAVGVGSTPYGVGVEGRLDLSTRLGLGLLGGLLAGLGHGVLTLVAGWLDLPGLLGAGLDLHLGVAAWWNRVVAGAIWGVALGAVYPILPAGSFLKRGATFGLLLALFQLFYVYPFRLDLGLAGLDLGWGVVPLVGAGAILAGALAAWPLAWAERGTDGSPSAPLVPAVDSTH